MLRRSTKRSATSPTRTGYRSATVTLRVHPRFGQRVRVRGGHGPAAVWAETEDGRLTILPVAWTDLTLTRPEVTVGGRPVRLCPEALRQLAQWVASRLEAGRDG